MGFTEIINEDIKKAMLAREKEKLAALRDIKSKLLLEATSGSGEVSDEAGIKICMKLHKQRMETYELYIAQNRQDLADDELFQAKISILRPSTRHIYVLLTFEYALICTMQVMRYSDLEEDHINPTDFSKEMNKIYPFEVLNSRNSQHECAYAQTHSYSLFHTLSSTRV